jgi:dihydroorotate dehydrogenase
MYGVLFRWLFTRMDAERVHRIAFWMLRAASHLPGCLALLRFLYRPRSLRTRVDALGCTFDSPLGLAAGFDKDATAYHALAAFGYGFVEVGTLTGEAQPGNPRPRMFRLPADRGLLNRLGFNNGGSAAAAARLRGPRCIPVGVNIGKTKRVPDEQAIDDYVLSARRLGLLADYIVVNVSSPNTPGLRDLQATERLEPLLKAVRSELESVSPGRRIPLLVKIAPDLADEDIDAVGALALRLGLEGIIATNTTISRQGLVTSETDVAALGAGGISGAPLKERSLEVLRRLRRSVGARVVLIGVGGIESAEDAFARIRAGATLVQAYTGFIYGGPGWPARIHRDLDRLLRESGMASIGDAVGVDAAS